MEPVDVLEAAAATFITDCKSVGVNVPGESLRLSQE